MKPTVWDISVSATVRVQGTNGGLMEAVVTIPLNIARLPVDVVDDIIATARMPLSGDEGGNSWD